jgi:hypothetical protein
VRQSIVDGNDAPLGSDTEREHRLVNERSATTSTSMLRQRTFQALFTGAVFDQISHSVGVIFTPLYLGALGAGPALVGFVIGVTTFANPLIILSAGSLIERVPPRRLIVATRGMEPARCCWLSWPKPGGNWRRRWR